MKQSDVILMLEDGRAFKGQSLGASGECFGEVVFNTSMTGYQEVLSDPSYAGQIVVFTATQIGNTGINTEDRESPVPQCVGVVVREASPVASSWRSESTLDDHLKEHGVQGAEGIDTRALTRAIRLGGAQRGAISADTNSADSNSERSLLDRIKAQPEMSGLDLVSKVTCAKPYEFSEGAWVAPDMERIAKEMRHHVVAYDFGVKENILRLLCEAGCKVTVVPARTPAKDVLALKPSGIFLSNGPGDPAAVDYAIEAIAELTVSGIPMFGICLGHQLLALALGAKTYKLPFGHHGANHPVLDCKTGKVAITSQNHGFAVEKELAEGMTMTHLNLFDQSVAGFSVRDKPIFGVQYHPEASPGPHDAAYLFDHFARSMG